MTFVRIERGPWIVNFDTGEVRKGEADPVNTIELVERRDEMFFDIFKGAEELGTDEIGEISEGDEKKSITSFEMNDCIALFAIEKTLSKISKVICYHIGTCTDHDEMEEEFQSVEIKADLHYEIVLIGGNNNKKFEELKNTILTYLPKAFTNHEIVGEYYQLIVGSGYDYISANMTIEGELSYCKHN